MGKCKQAYNHASNALTQALAIKEKVVSKTRLIQALEQLVECSRVLALLEEQGIIKWEPKP